MGALDDLAEAVLLAPKGDDRQTIGEARLPALRAVAVVARTLESPFRVLESTLEQAEVECMTP